MYFCIKLNDMKRFITTLAAIICLVTTSFSQDVGNLPDDPRVKRGSLPNGLSYILVKNNAEAGYAHFGIAQRVGTTLEEENQKGMFKMLEALTVKGTRNFTDSTITQYLKSIGVKPHEVSFDTREDDITYLIKNIPVSRANTIDSSLLILYNWLNSINIDEEDVREEAPYVKNRLLSDWDAAKRLDDKLINELYPRSRYAMNLRPEDVEQIDRFTSKDLRNFYYKWFRPDFQAVVIVGDIDLNLIETKVKSIFATIPKPLGKQNRSYYTPQPFDGVKVSILKDKEYNKTEISIDILKAPLVNKYKNTSVPFIQKYMDSAISGLLLARLRDGIISNNLPVTNIAIKKGKFMNIHNQESFSITFETLPNMIYSAISFVNAEIGRMARYGFSSQEFSKSKDMYFRELESVYDNRAKLGNDVYLQRALGYFYDNTTLASTELEFEIMKEILFTISLSELNQYAQAMLGQSDNVVIACRMPEYEGIKGLTPDRVLSAYNDAGLKTPSMEPVTPIVKWPEFVQGPVAASISSEVEDPVTGAKVMILSNGATVVLKKNASDTISFRAVSKGGYSLMPGVNYGNEKYVNDILNLGGLDNISQPNLERLFSYYNFKVDARINQNSEELDGYSDVDNIEKLFHTIYMSMTSRRADETAFDVYKKAKIFETSYRSLAPSAVFKDSILYYNYSNKNYIRRAEKEDVQEIDYSKVLSQTRARFANAADFVFIFVGNVDESQYRDLVVKYIGAIPGNSSKKEDWMVVPNYLTKGKVYKRFLHRMINPRTFSNITLSYGMAYNLQNFVMAQMADTYLKGVLEQRNNRRYIKQYGLRTELSNYPEEILAINVQFETDSLNAENVSRLIVGALERVAKCEFSESQLQELKLSLKDKFLAESASNQYWLNLLEHRYIIGKDFLMNYLKTAESVTSEMFSGFMSDLMKKGNMVTVIMDGTTKDVNTQNLFKEDVFIKEYFDFF